MIKNILTVGDSFTYGEELADRNNAWPCQLSNLIQDSRVTNLAKPGSGNRRMIRYVVDQLINDSEIDLVAIGWSSPGRMEFADDDGEFDIWPGYHGNLFRRAQEWRIALVDYINRHHNSGYLYKQYLLDVILMQDFLKQRSIKYVMFNTVSNEYYHNIYFSRMTPLAKLVDATYYLGWPTEGMAEWTEGCKKGPGMHFLDDGHTIVAKKVYEHIRHLGWIS